MCVRGEGEGEGDKGVCVGRKEDKGKERGH